MQKLAIEQHGCRYIVVNTRYQTREKQPLRVSAHNSLKEARAAMAAYEAMSARAQAG